MKPDEKLEILVVDQIGKSSALAADIQYYNRLDNNHGGKDSTPKNLNKNAPVLLGRLVVWAASKRASNGPILIWRKKNNKNAADDQISRG